MEKIQLGISFMEIIILVSSTLGGMYGVFVLVLKKQIKLEFSKISVCSRSELQTHEKEFKDFKKCTNDKFELLLKSQKKIREAILESEIREVKSEIREVVREVKDNKHNLTEDIIIKSIEAVKEGRKLKINSNYEVRIHFLEKTIKKYKEKN